MVEPNSRRAGFAKKIILRTVGVTILVAVLFVVLGPIVWSVSTSFKAPREILSAPPSLIPDTVTTEHYARLVRENVVIFFRNSAVNAALTVSVGLLLGASAGYALSRFRFRFSNLLLVFYVGSMTIPAYSLLLPTQSIFNAVGLLDTRLTLPILYTAHVVPFIVWITKTHFDSMPNELEQAARMDGYSRLQSVWRVVLPGTKPALIAGGTFAFLVAWNDYITAATMTPSPANRTLPVALIFFQGFHGREWGPLMAGVVLAVIPPVVLFLVFRKFLVGGFMSGAIKG